MEIGVAFRPLSVLYTSPATCITVACHFSPSLLATSTSFWGDRHDRVFGNHKSLQISWKKPREATNKAVKGGIPRAYSEPSNSPVMKFLNQIQGSLPVIGLLSRIMSAEGGIGNDRVQFVEFCTRVEKASSFETSRAFFSFADRHGKVGKAQYVLIWCWAAAVGAGLLSTDDLLLGASRLRVSHDIQYEVENMNLLMDEATKKRAKSKASPPVVPIEARAQRALEAICKCSLGNSPLLEVDGVWLSTILKTVFPTADSCEIDAMINARIAYDSNSSFSTTQLSEVLDQEETVNVENTSLIQ